jgi:lysozyme family protein
MANFSEAIEKTLKSEGFYVFDGRDSGGETYCGISRNNFPNWRGWEEVDAVKREKGSLQSNTQLPSADIYVGSFYKENFWNKILGDGIADQVIAESIFDFAVNAGVTKAVLAAQEVLNKQFLFLDITFDGLMGSKTLSRLNELEGKSFNYRGYTVASPLLFVVIFDIIRMRFYVKTGITWPLKAWFKRTFEFFDAVRV